jgi:hypothetical protein
MHMPTVAGIDLRLCARDYGVQRALVLFPF